MGIFCLTVHASYACRHSGACCTAGWQIPVEPDVRRTIEIRGIRSRSDTLSPLFVAGDPSSRDGAVIAARHDNGACTFFEPDHGRVCAIHRKAGPGWLPSACRHFPRVVLQDRRGTFITLSHFCPTAAALLCEPMELAVIEAPGSLLPAGAIEGLDATAVLPPLLRPGLLTDLDGYTAWERAGIEVLNRQDLRPEDALDVIARATRDVCGWRPGTATMSEQVGSSFAAHADRGPSPGLLHVSDRPARGFVAAHLFANWVAYQGTGLEAVVEYLRDALALLRREAVACGSFVEGARAADLRLRHRESSRRAEL